MFANSLITSFFGSVTSQIGRTPVVEPSEQISDLELQ